MQIVVLVKVVPDTYGDRRLSLETGLTDRTASDAVIDEIDERALEVALRFAEHHDGVEIIALSMAPEEAAPTLRKALAMGADRAVQVTDPVLLGADVVLTAEVLAAAIRRIDFDLIVAGNASTDGASGMVPIMVAELLGVPAIAGLSTLELTADTVTGSRTVEQGVQQVAAELPAVVSVTEGLPEARFPNFKGIMAAKKKPFETVTAADLGVTVDPGVEARSIVLSVQERPARGAGVTLVDDGDAGTRLAEYLIQNRLV